MSKDLETIFIKLIQEHAGIIKKVIGLYVESPTNKEDLSQEIMLQAWKSFPKFENKSSFSTWLYKVALNTVFTFNRKKKNTIEISEDHIIKKETNRDNKDNSELLYFFIKKLKEADRLLISLHLDGFKNSEIAEILGLKTNHVNVKIFRIKNHLINQIKNYENGHL